MKKITEKLVAIGISCAVCLGGIGATVLALQEDDKEVIDAKSVVNAANANNEEETEIVKDETVYVLANADGSINKIIVSDWIKNAISSDSLSDRSSLTDIDNVKGNEGYTVSGDNMKVWDAKGNDIYYRGNIEKELPVGISVSYKLDGKDISAEDLAGKSGKVTIRFDYTNNQYEMVEIDGKEEKIYVPFLMLTGMLLDSDSFRNVEVTNGKMLNDGDHTAVIGFALPGLVQNLGNGIGNTLKNFIDIPGGIGIPDYVEVTADVKDFSLGITLTLATNELFNLINTDYLDMYDMLGELVFPITDAISQLADGSSALYDGICTLLDKSGELVSAIDLLANGASQLYDGTVELDGGLQSLVSGISDLKKGLETITSNNSVLNGGAKQVFESLLQMANDQITASGISVPKLTINNYGTVIDSVVASLNKDAVYAEALKTVKAMVEANRSLIEKGVTEEVRNKVKAEVISAVKEQVEKQVAQAVRYNTAELVVPYVTKMAMTRDAYYAALQSGTIDQSIYNAVEAVLDAQMQSEDMKVLVEYNTEKQLQSDEVSSIIELNTDEQMKSPVVSATIQQYVELQINSLIEENMASDAVQSKLSQAEEGKESLKALKVSLDSYNVFYNGVISYTGGVAEAAKGAGTIESGSLIIKSGASQLKVGAKSLLDGILEFKNGIPVLTSGITQLKDGAEQIYGGLDQFKTIVTEIVSSLTEGEIKNLILRIKATIDVSKDYQNFSGISDEMSGNVKFIYRTSEINVK